jgi:hypothetical protein
MTIKLANAIYAISADQIQTMIDQITPHGHKRRVTVVATNAVLVVLAVKQRERGGSEYSNETVEQIAWETKLTMDQVKRVLAVLHQSGWVITIAHGGNGYGSRRKLALPNFDDHGAVQPTKTQTDHDGINNDHGVDHGAVQPTTPINQTTADEIGAVVTTTTPSQTTDTTAPAKAVRDVETRTDLNDYGQPADAVARINAFRSSIPPQKPKPRHRYRQNE